MIFLSHFPKIGRLIKLFVVSDLVLLSGWGLVQPIFAIFITTSIVGATVITVGTVAAIYWLTKVVFQLPIALLIDKKDGEKDNFMVLIFGLVLAGISAFAFIFIDQIWQLYLIQGLHALGMSMYTPAWSSIFSKHLDNGHEALDWSLDNSSLALAAGVTGLLSGYLVTWFGFPVIFFIASILSLLAAFIIFLTPKLIFYDQPKNSRNSNRN